MPPTTPSPTPTSAPRCVLCGGRYAAPLVLSNAGRTAAKALLGARPEYATWLSFSPAFGFIQVGGAGGVAGEGGRRGQEGGKGGGERGGGGRGRGGRPGGQTIWPCMGRGGGGEVDALRGDGGCVLQPGARRCYRSEPGVVHCC